MTSSSRIRMRLKSYDHRALDIAVMQIIENIKRTGANFSGPIPLPRRIRKFTVLRSPHIDKKARDQFEIRTHNRVIYISDCSTPTLEAMMNLNISSQVDVEIKV